MDKNKLDLIFKSYDIRGVFNDEINTSDAFKIAKAFSYFVKADEIIIGHDGRISNLEMYSAVAAGVKSTGTNVRYIGLVPTDVVYSVSGLLKHRELQETWQSCVPKRVFLNQLNHQAH